jgi:hypothetical protein
MRVMWLLGGLLFVLVAAGCAAHPALRTESSTSAIRAAEEIGAGDVPRASFHLQAAKEELAGAKDLSEKGHKDEAESLLMRAEADGELAILLSREQSEKTEAAQAMERVRQLQKDNQ